MTSLDLNSCEVRSEIKGSCSPIRNTLGKNFIYFFKKRDEYFLFFGEIDNLLVNCSILSYTYISYFLFLKIRQLKANSPRAFLMRHFHCFVPNHLSLLDVIAGGVYSTAIIKYMVHRWTITHMKTYLIIINSSNFDSI